MVGLIRLLQRDRHLINHTQLMAFIDLFFKDINLFPDLPFYLPALKNENIANAFINDEFNRIPSEKLKIPYLEVANIKHYKKEINSTQVQNSKKIYNFTDFCSKYHDCQGTILIHVATNWTDSDEYQYFGDLSTSEKTYLFMEYLLCDVP